MLLRKKKEITCESMGLEAVNLPGSFLRSLHFYEHWRTVGQMFRNYPGVDTTFDQLTRNPVRGLFLHWIGWPLYFGLSNQGFGLWLTDGNNRPQLAGQIYLQHRKMITHINDIEVNKPFQGRGYSHTLLALAEQQARLNNKQFLTLAVTLSNSRAVNLYRKSGFVEQHHRYFYLARPWWSHATSPYSPLSSPVRLVPLKFAAARRNLRRFFTLEIQTGEPQVAAVWESFYRPSLPRPGAGFSFALYDGERPLPRGHADFFDWQGQGRWQIYLEPALWGTATEQLFFEALLHQSRSYNQLGLSVGTAAHHQAALAFTRTLGLVERDTERMLMVRQL